MTARRAEHSTPLAKRLARGGIVGKITLVSWNSETKPQQGKRPPMGPIAKRPPRRAQWTVVQLESAEPSCSARPYPLRLLDQDTGLPVHQDEHVTGFGLCRSVRHARSLAPERCKSILGRHKLGKGVSDGRGELFDQEFPAL